MLTENFAWLGKVRFHFLKMENQLKVNLYLPSWKRIKAAKITAKIPVCFIWNTETVMKQISNKKMISLFSAVKGLTFYFLSVPRLVSLMSFPNVIYALSLSDILLAFFGWVYPHSIPHFIGWLNPLPCRLFKIVI